MAGNAKRGGGGDRILESRHLVGLFLGVVLLCGVFFTLGYVMGRTQFGGAVHAADSPVKNLSPVVAPTKTSSRSVPEAAKPGPDNWDFDPKPAEKRPEPPPPAKSTALPAVFNKDPNPPAPPPA